MNEPVKLPPGAKMYYRNSDSEDWKELDSLSRLGADPTGGADRTVITVVDGTTTISDRYDANEMDRLLLKLSFAAGRQSFDTATLRKHAEKFREQPKGIPAVARHLAGRNDPCPCGSGRKYKKCHLG